MMSSSLFDELQQLQMTLAAQAAAMPPEWGASQTPPDQRPLNQSSLDLPAMPPLPPQASREEPSPPQRRTIGDKRDKTPLTSSAQAGSALTVSEAGEETGTKPGPNPPAL